MLLCVARMLKSSGGIVIRAPRQRACAKERDGRANASAHLPKTSRCPNEARPHNGTHVCFALQVTSEGAIPNSTAKPRKADDLLRYQPHKWARYRGISSRATSSHALAAPRKRCLPLRTMQRTTRRDARRNHDRAPPQATRVAGARADSAPLYARP